MERNSKIRNFYIRVKPFFNYCKYEAKLGVVGSMIIPPNDHNTQRILNLYELNKSIGLKELSMGMSADYLKTKYGSTL